jgi:hypothetical protein
MSSVWPIPGDTVGAWGTTLNNGLAVAHNNDGTVKVSGGAVTAGQVVYGGASGQLAAAANLRWNPSTGSGTALLIDTPSGQYAYLLLLNGGTAYWQIFNSPAGGGGNEFVISNTSNATVFAALQTGVLYAPQYAPGIAGFGAGGAIGSFAAWTAWSPTVTPSSGSFTSAPTTARYLQIGKTVFFELTCTPTFTAASGTFNISLPSTAPPMAWPVCIAINGSTITVGVGVIENIGIIVYGPGNTTLFTSGGNIWVTGVYEAS